MQRHSTTAGILAVTLLCALPAYSQVAPDVSPSELLLDLSAAGVSGGAYLTPATDVVRPRELRSVVRMGASTDEVLAAFKYNHPQWNTDVSNGVVNIMQLQLPGSFARVFNLTVTEVPIIDAFQRLLNKIDPKAPITGVVGSTSRPGEVVRDELARFVVSFDLQGVPADEALNDLVRQVPGAVWIAVHHEGRNESFDTIRLYVPNGIVFNYSHKVRLQIH